MLREYHFTGRQSGTLRQMRPQPQGTTAAAITVGTLVARRAKGGKEEEEIAS